MNKGVEKRDMAKMAISHFWASCEVMHRLFEKLPTICHFLKPTTALLVYRDLYQICTEVCSDAWFVNAEFEKATDPKESQGTCMNEGRTLELHHKHAMGYTR